MENQTNDNNTAANETASPAPENTTQGIGMEKIFYGVVIIAIAAIAMLLLTSGSPAVAGTAQAPNLAAAAYVANSQPAQAQGPSQPTTAPAATQEIALSFQNGAYYPYEIHVKKGVPVKLVADMNSIRGCMTTVIMPAFGVRKTLSSGDNAIEFTPTQTGTFDYTCGMGMGRGKIIVE